MPQPQPGEFDRGSSGAGVAGFGNPLIALHSTARPRARDETEIASDFAAVMEVTKKYLVGQYRGTHQADAAQTDQPRRLNPPRRRALPPARPRLRQSSR